MRIAVPTDDGMSISEHFGRSAAFLIFEVEGEAIRTCAMTANGGCHTHAAGDCAQDTGGNERDSHTAIVSTLTGSDVVICAGMGRRAAEALKSAGIREIVLTEAGPAAETVHAYLEGRLIPKTDGFCGCRH